MLYDPQWKSTTAPLTLESFAAWLETKSGPYEFNCEKCAIGSYLTEHGFSVVMLGTMTWTDVAGNLNNLPDRWNEIAILRPWTYEAAAKRARGAIAE